MATKISNVSQRANQGDRKVVFKSALENPHRVAWPAVPLNLQNMILASLLSLLEGVGEFNLQKQAAHRKIKRAKHDKERREKAQARKRQKKEQEQEQAQNGSTEPTSVMKDPSDVAMTDDLNNEGVENVPVTKPETPLTPEPQILSHLTYGINEVTKQLERQAESRRYQEVVSITESSERAEVTSPQQTKSHLSHVFVCQSDIDPPLLIAHLPELVASCNIPIPTKSLIPVYLIPLPKRAESVLAESLAVKRVSILALDVDTPRLETITKLLSTVQPPSASWLIPRTRHSAKPSTKLVPTHIKQLRTTAPRDMRKAKEERAKGREAAKERRKEQNIKTKMKNVKVKRKLKIVSVSKELLPT